MEKDIGKIKKNDSTDIVVRIDDFGGRVGLTIREFTSSDRYTGFTKSGTRIPAEAFKEFKELINSINENDFANTNAGEERKESEEIKSSVKTDKKQKTLTNETESDEIKDEIKEEVY